MNKKAFSVIPVLGHSMSKPVPFQDGRALDDWYRENHDKIANWCVKEDNKIAKVIIVFFRYDRDALAMIKAAA
jgi:hypothetical protein